MGKYKEEIEERVKRITFNSASWKVIWGVFMILTALLFEEMVITISILMIISGIINLIGVAMVIKNEK